MPVIRPSRGTHVLIDRERLPLNAAAIVPAGGERTIFALPWLGQTPGRDDRQRLRGQPRAPAGRRGRRRVPAGGGQRVLRDGLRLRRRRRRLRRRAAADLDRRPEEERRHLAQGRALRDLVRHDHDHRRQAHDLAPDGEDGRSTGWSSASSARRPAAPTRSRSGTRSNPRELQVARRRARGARCSTSRAATATSPSGCWSCAWSGRSSARRSSRACPTCWSRRWSPRASSRRARCRTCCCGAPGWGCSRGGACSQDEGAVKRVAQVMGSELGWNRRQVKREAERWREAVDEEGLVTRPAGGRLRHEHALGGEHRVVGGGRAVLVCAAVEHPYLAELPDGAPAVGVGAGGERVHGGGDGAVRARGWPGVRCAGDREGVDEGLRGGGAGAARVGRVELVGDPHRQLRAQGAGVVGEVDVSRRRSGALGSARRRSRP